MPIDLTTVPTIVGDDGLIRPHPSARLTTEGYLAVMDIHNPRWRQRRPDDETNCVGVRWPRLTRSQDLHEYAHDHPEDFDHGDAPDRAERMHEAHLERLEP